MGWSEHFAELNGVVAGPTRASTKMRDFWENGMFEILTPLKLVGIFRIAELRAVVRPQHVEIDRVDCEVHSAPMEAVKLEPYVEPRTITGPGFLKVFAEHDNDRRLPDLLDETLELVVHRTRNPREPENRIDTVTNSERENRRTCRCDARRPGECV